MSVLGGFVLAMIASFAQGASLEPVATIPLPDVKGRIDHFAVDVKGRRLFVAALGNDTVEVLDIAHNRHERSLKGFGEPQGLLYLPETQLLYVANGSSNRLDILDARTFAPARRMDKLDDADNVRYDASAGSVIVGYGTGALRIVDAATGAAKGDIRLDGHPESFQVERGGGRLFVNVPTQRQVAVVDRAKGAVVATWRVSARQNFPMALDEKGRRLFSGARFPAVLLVHDLDTGKEVARLEIGEDTDDLFIDAERKRVYVICGEGRVDVFRRESPDRYLREGSVKTAPKARTGLFVPEEGKLYVAAPASGGTAARILVYAVH
jgi:DNA-binding beta-propeller fold protein YncE